MRQRRVRFPDDSNKLHWVVCTLPHREDYTRKEFDALFFSKNDYIASRADAKKISRESERYGYSKHLANTFCEKNSDAQERLNLWVEHGDSRRGLERWAHRDHGEQRQQDQFKAIMKILREQDDMLLKNKQLDVERLRKVSHKATKRARHFARMMGKADCHAVAAEMTSSKDDGDDAESVLTEAMTTVTAGNDDFTVGADSILSPSEQQATRHSLKLFGLGRKKNNNNSRGGKDARVSRVAR